MGFLPLSDLEVVERRLDNRRERDPNGARHPVDPLHDPIKLLKPTARAINGKRVSRSDHDSRQSMNYRPLRLPPARLLCLPQIGEAINARTAGGTAYGLPASRLALAGVRSSVDAAPSLSGGGELAEGRWRSASTRCSAPAAAATLRTAASTRRADAAPRQPSAAGSPLASGPRAGPRRRLNLEPRPILSSDGPALCAVPLSS